MVRLPAVGARAVQINEMATSRSYRCMLFADDPDEMAAGHFGARHDKMR